MKPTISLPVSATVLPVFAPSLLSAISLIYLFGNQGLLKSLLFGTSIYGPLAAPIVLMIWLYVLSIAVLIGAALNAAVESVWPRREVQVAQAKAKALEQQQPGPDGRRRRLKRPGLDTGEIELPPNRPPVDNPLAPSNDQR